MREYENNGFGINAKKIDENSEGLIETFEKTLDNSNSINDQEQALIELYEMIIGGNE